jgi:hypothetical protein
VSLAFLVLAAALPAQTVSLCYHYHCARQWAAVIPGSAWEAARDTLVAANDPASERVAVSLAVGTLMRAAVTGTPLQQDLPRNPWQESDLEGRMDCIDHSSNTDTLLRALQARGWLRFHTVGSRALRHRWVFAAHRAATLVERDGGAAWAVDTWYRPAGHPAWVVPLPQWTGGARPDD